jgi:membrane protein YdbS with pleckstrin-like domain
VGRRGRATRGERHRVAQRHRVAWGHGTGPLLPPPGTLTQVPISRRVLADDEEVLVDLRPHWVFLLGPVVLTVVAVAVAIAVVVEFPKAPVAVAGVLAVMVAVPALWLAGRVIRWLGISLVVTTTRLIYRRGVLGRDFVQLRLQRVTEIHCTQTVTDRLIGSGRLVVEIAGEEPMVIVDVRRPRALQRVIARQLDELASGGPHVEVVPGGDVSVPPVGMPSPLFLDDTPPHGVLATSGPAPVPLAAEMPYAAPVSGAGASIPDQLIQLDDLRRRGIISEGEFAAKKAELLSRL